MQSATVSDQSPRRCTLPYSYLKDLKTSSIFHLFNQITGFNSNTIGLSPSFKLPFLLLILWYSSLVQRKEIMGIIFFLPHKEPKASLTELLSLSQC